MQEVPFTITDLLGKHIQIVEKAEGWEDAIRMAAAPLLENGSIRVSYTDTMIHNVEANGPYVAMMPDVMMPHSRVEDGVLETDISILKLKDGVAFPRGDIVYLIIVLFVNDNDVHMQLFSDVVDVSMDEDKMNGPLHAERVEDIRRVPA